LEGAEEKKIEKKTTTIDVDDFIFNFNPDAFVERKDNLVIYEEDDEATKNVRLASQYLRDVVLAEFLAEAAANTFTVTDGFFLTKLLHRKGINMRYLGLLAKKIDQEGDKVDFGKAQNKNEAEYTLRLLKNTLESEMVIRAAKHLLNRQLRSASPYDHSFVVAHFLNCLLGASFNTAPVAETAILPVGAEADRSWTEVTPSSVRSEIINEVAARFRYELPSTFIDEQLPKIKATREISLRVGVQLLARKFDFGTGAPDLSVNTEPTPSASAIEAPSIPSSLKNKKKKKSGKAAAEEKKIDLPPTTFTADDVLNLGPVVKATAHKSSLVDETFQHGQRAIAEGQIEIGEAVVNEALHLCEQIFGAVHPEQAQKYHSLGLGAQPPSHPVLSHKK
jgi:protein TIF31